jgi:hypothetical protein
MDRPLLASLNEDRPERRSEAILRYHPDGQISARVRVYAIRVASGIKIK